jgi:hypothetical protein
MNMLREDANHEALETRGFVVQVGGNSLDRFAMGQKLGLPRHAGRPLDPCQLVHRGIADPALHRLAIVHHREGERQPLAIVPANLATRQRHGNSRPFETIMRRPVGSVDQLRRGMGGDAANNARGGTSVIACGKREAFAQGSEATKQSILSLLGEMDCFASLAMTVPAQGPAPLFGRARKNEIIEPDQAVSTCPVPPLKNKSLRARPKSLPYFPPSRPT